MGAVLLFLVQAHFGWAFVLGESMQPGLHTGDLLLLNKQAYAHNEPQRGDVVVARRDRELVVKRIIGLPGEEVALSRGHLYINGLAQHEGYAIEPGMLNISAGRLVAGKFALMGDNRALDISQIVHAVVSKDQIVGRVMGAVPFSRVRALTTTKNRWAP